MGQASPASRRSPLPPSRRDRLGDGRATGRKGAGRLLDAKFTAFDEEGFKAAGTAGGYAREMSKD